MYAPDTAAYDHASENDYSFGELCAAVAHMQLQDCPDLTAVIVLENFWANMKSSISQDTQKIMDQQLNGLRTRALVDG